MSKQNIEDIYPLSPMQQGLLFHTVYAPESGVYIGQMACRLEGDLNIDALEQAIGHLIQNAVEACSSTNPISVRAVANDGSIAISIADKGVGMDPEFVRNQLFQPFSSSKPGGFGIGAFEARSLVVAMGGRLGVDSRPGKGTTFTILLPAAEPAIEPARKRA